MQGVEIDKSRDLLKRLEYVSTVEKILNYSSTSIVAWLGPGIILKYPHFSWWDSSATQTHDLIKSIKHNFSVEAQIFGIVGYGLIQVK